MGALQRLLMSSSHPVFVLKLRCLHPKMCAMLNTPSSLPVEEQCVQGEAEKGALTK
jgi:hypothetical protein